MQPLSYLYSIKESLIKKFNSQYLEQKDYILDVVYENIRKTFEIKPLGGAYSYRDFSEAAVKQGWAKSNQDFFQQLVKNHLVEDERTFQTGLIARLEHLKGKKIGDAFHSDLISELARNIYAQSTQQNDRPNEFETILQLYQSGKIFDEGEFDVIRDIAFKTHTLCQNDNEKKLVEQYILGHNFVQQLSTQDAKNAKELFITSLYAQDDLKKDWHVGLSHLEAPTNIQELLEYFKSNLKTFEQVHLLSTENFCLMIEKTVAMMDNDTKLKVRTQLPEVLNDIEDNFIEHNLWAQDFVLALNSVFSNLDNQFMKLKNLYKKDDLSENKYEEWLNETYTLAHPELFNQQNPMEHNLVQKLFLQRLPEKYLDLEILQSYFEDMMGLNQINLSQLSNKIVKKFKP